jgi:hypothetical protein
MIKRRALALAFLAACASAGLAHAASEGDGRTPRRITSSELYVPTATLAAPITNEYSFAGLLVVDAGFDIPDPALRARVIRMAPRLTDALRTSLAEYTYSRYRAGAAPDPDRISAMLQEAADRTIGQPGAKLLLSNVMVQRGR